MGQTWKELISLAWFLFHCLEWSQSSQETVREPKKCSVNVCPGKGKIKFLVNNNSCHNNVFKSIKRRLSLVETQK